MPRVKRTICYVVEEGGNGIKVLAAIVRTRKPQSRDMFSVGFARYAPNGRYAGRTTAVYAVPVVFKSLLHGVGNRQHLTRGIFLANSVRAVRERAFSTRTTRERKDEKTEFTRRTSAEHVKEEIRSSPVPATKKNNHIAKEKIPRIHLRLPVSKRHKHATVDCTAPVLPIQLQGGRLVLT